MEPFINGVTINAKKHKAEDVEVHRQGLEGQAAVERPCGLANLGKHFSQWSTCVEAYNARLLDDKRRVFPTQLLLGAEEILARLHHEHHKSKVYTPLEILSRRTFAADGTTTAGRRTPPTASSGQGRVGGRLRKGVDTTLAHGHHRWGHGGQMGVNSCGLRLRGGGHGLRRLV